MSTTVIDQMPQVATVGPDKTSESPDDSPAAAAAAIANHKKVAASSTTPASSAAKIVSSSSSTSSLDETPKIVFKRMADNDARQNRQILSSINSLNTASSGTDLIRGDGSKGGGGRRGSTNKMRFVVCTLGLMSLAMSQMARMVLNYSIVQMVDPSMAKPKDTGVSDEGSCPSPIDEASIMLNPPMSNSSTAGTTYTTTGSTTTTTTTQDDTIYSTTTGPFNSEASTFYYLSSSLPTTTQANPFRFMPSSTSAYAWSSSTSGLSSSYTDDATTTEQTTTTTTSASKTTNDPPAQRVNGDSDQFMWDIKDQQFLLGSFFYTYPVFMVFGGRMAEMYGAKYVLMLGVAGSALICLATPWMARNSFALLILSRCVMGAIQSGVFPGMYALINKWLTMSEASIFAPLIKMNLRLGMVLGSMIPGIMDRWPNVFYLTGGLLAVWSILWMLIATSDPTDNKWVTEAELAHINRKKPQAVAAANKSSDIEAGTKSSMELRAKETTETSSGKGDEEKIEEKTPWLGILTSPSVIGLIIVKLTFNFALDFLAIQLPSYLQYVQHATKEQTSGITTPMFAIQVVLIVFVGWLAKSVVQRRPYGMSKTLIRKTFQGIASFGISAGFFLLTFNDCNLFYVGIIVQLVSFLSMFTAGGETMLPYDLSSKYPATIMAIANSVANMSGSITTTLAGMILGGKKGQGNYSSWNLLIYLIAGANLVGGLAFSCLVRAEPIDLSANNSKQKQQQQAELRKPNKKKTTSTGLKPENSTSMVEVELDK